MKLYLAGPMTGVPKHNFPAFESAAALLRAAGHEVVSPRELSGRDLEEALETPWEMHLRRDLTAMLNCEAVIVLPGWEGSRGARLEVTTARGVEMPVFDLSFAKVEVTTFGDDEVARYLEHPELTELVTDERTGAVKADGGKARTDLLPVFPLMETARVLAFGAEKYSPDNWRLGFDWSRVYGAALRHMLAFWAGEDLDPETGLSHLGHALCCIMFLLEYTDSGAGNDDRWTTTKENDG